MSLVGAVHRGISFSGRARHTPPGSPEISVATCKSVNVCVPPRFVLKSNPQRWSH